MLSKNTSKCCDEIWRVNRDGEGRRLLLVSKERIMATTRGSSAARGSAGASRPASGTGSASGASGSARPFSSTNLSATVASSRFKTFAVQYEILNKNPILCELAKEVPWKNLLDLFTLKFYAVGDALWRHGDQPTELAFVLCGGFLVRHVIVDEHDATVNVRSRTTYGGSIAAEERTETIVAEKMLKPGASIAVYAVDQTTPIRYSVVTAKFKSISIALPLGKFKSIMRQLTPSTKATLQQLILENEIKLCAAIKLPPPQAHRARGSRASTAPTPSTIGHVRHSPMKKSASTPALLSGDPAVAALSNSHAASWDSLHVAQPVEYEVDSSLLILHDSELKNKLHIPTTVNSASEQLRAKLLRSSSSSTAIRTIAKKHTTRRLQSIKLPATIDAFPPQPNKYRNIEAEAMASASIAGAHSIDVVPKLRIGRLLAPIRKPAMVEVDATSHREQLLHHVSEPKPQLIQNAQQSLVGRHILLADRGKIYREEF